jgi:hypothetical protein
LKSNDKEFNVGRISEGLDAALRGDPDMVGKIDERDMYDGY